MDSSSFVLLFSSLSWGHPPPCAMDIHPKGNNRSSYLNHNNTLRNIFFWIFLLLGFAIDIFVGIIYIVSMIVKFVNIRRC